MLEINDDTEIRITFDNEKYYKPGDLKQYAKPRSFIVRIKSARCSIWGVTDTGKRSDEIYPESSSITLKFAYDDTLRAILVGGIAEFTKIPLEKFRDKPKSETDSQMRYAVIPRTWHTDFKPFAEERYYEWRSVGFEIHPVEDSGTLQVHFTRDLSAEPGEIRDSSDFYNNIAKVLFEMGAKHDVYRRG